MSHNCMQLQGSPGQIGPSLSPGFLYVALRYERPEP